MKIRRALSKTTSRFLASTFLVASVAGPSLYAQVPEMTFEDEEIGNPISLNLLTEGDIPAESSPVSDPELIQQRYPDGKVMVERWVVESDQGDIVNHGSFVRYNESGEVVLSGTYLMGQQQGEWEKQISNEEAKALSNSNLVGFTAPFRSTVQFDRNAVNGEWTCKDSKGNVVFIWSFVSGNREGTSTWFNSSGKVLQQLTYRQNMAHGPAIVALTPEEAPKEQVFESGRMQRRVDRHFENKAVNGQQVLKSQDWYLVPTPFNVETNDWNQNRVTYQPFDSEQVVRHGRSINYYENGQRESEGYYLNGERHGTFAWWYPNGQQKTIGDYQSDAEEGDWVWWHQNGMKEASGTYLAGKKVDRWSVWSDVGRLVKRTNVTEKRVASTPAPLELK